MTELTEKEKSVLEMYACDDNPLIYQIKPRGTFDIIESRKITKEDLEEENF